MYNIVASMIILLVMIFRLGLPYKGRLHKAYNLDDTNVFAFEA